MRIRNSFQLYFACSTSCFGCRTLCEVSYRISAELVHVHTNSTTNTGFNMIGCLSDCCLAADEFLNQDRVVHCDWMEACEHILPQSGGM